MLWNVGMFYYAGEATTPEGQISGLALEFNSLVLLTGDEGATYDLTTLVSRINAFWNAQPTLQILVEIPNPDGAMTYPYMKARLDEIEEQAGGMVRGYCLTPKGPHSMWNEIAVDSSYCRDNVRDIVSDVRSLSKYAVWMPVDDSMDEDMVDQCQSHIYFTNISPNAITTRPRTQIVEGVRSEAKRHATG